jgi:subtilisin
MRSSSLLSPRIVSLSLFTLVLIGVLLLPLNSEVHSVGQGPPSNSRTATPAAPATPTATATTQSASNITMTGFQMNGTINPNGVSTQAYFEYGTSSTLSSFTATGASTFGGTSAISLSSTLSGGICGTTYYYRMVAAPTGGSIVRGNIVAVTTLACATPTATTQAASNITMTGFQMNGTINPNGVSTQAYFEWGTSSTLSSFNTTGATTIGGTSPIGLQSTLSGGSCGTTYYYRMVGAPTGGSPVRGSIVAVTTLACATPTVTTQAASNITMTGFQMNGTINPNGVSTQAYFEWGTSSTLSSFNTTGSTTIGGTSPIGLQSTLSGGTCGTTYYYRMVGAPTGGSPVRGSIVAVTTLACATPTVTTQAASNITMTGFQMNGTINPNGVSTQAYFEWGTSSTLSSFNTTGSTTIGGTSPINLQSTLSGGTCGTSYYYRMVAAPTGGGSIVRGSIVAVTTLACAQTCNALTANVSPNGGGTVSINVPSNCSSGATAPEAGITLDQPITTDVTPLVESRRSLAMAEAFATLISKAETGGPIAVIIGLNVPFRPEATLLGSYAIQQQRTSIAEAQDSVLSELSNYDPASVKKYFFIPAMAVKVDATDLRRLESSSDVSTIEEDLVLSPTLAESVPLIGAPAAWANGFTGSGQTVAILDTGVDKTHPFLSGKVVSEACYSSNLCPGGATASTAPGSGVNCNVSIAGCDHGTHVAGIAAGKGTSFSGVAKDANIIAIQVFSQNLDGSIGASSSDILSGLQRVQVLSSSFTIAAANLSLGNGSHNTSNCDSQDPQMKAGIDAIRLLGIATVVASDNKALVNGTFTNGIAYPACLSSTISVGSTGDGSGGLPQDSISDSSQSSALLSLLAPGDLIYSSVPGVGFSNKSGTSMATPHVTGAWAVLKSKSPSASVDQILNAFTNTGLAITDTRNGVTKSRIRVDAAANALGGGASDQYTPGTVVTLTPAPANGYSFQSWSGCDSLSGNNCTVTMNAARTVTANFTPVVRTLTIASSNPSSGVSITVSPNDNNNQGSGATQFTRTYNNNTSVNLTAQSTASGNNFQKWQRDGADWSFSQSTSVTMDTNHTMTAVYVPPTTVQVTVQTNPSGRSFTVDGVTHSSTQTFPWISGSSHTIGTSSPQSGGTGTQYAWNSWSDGGAISHNVAPTSNTIFTANFTTQYFLTMNAGVGGIVSPGSGYFNSGQSVQISAIANIGFTFSSWTGSGSGSFTGATNPVNVTMNGPLSETAGFTSFKSRKTGVFRPSTGELFLKNANSSGFADTHIIFGNPGDYPVAGDWNGDGVDSVGIYRNAVFYLRNSNTTGFADIVVPFGSPGDQPVVGDWNGDGVDTIGVYRNGTFYLRNSNTAGPPDLVFTLGNPGDVGIAGDWNGDGMTTCGVFRPSNGIIYLKNNNTTGFADLSFVFGNAGDKPVAGDWNADGIDTIGIYRSGVFYLSNSNATGFADIVFVLGNSGDFPIAGNWNGSL